MRTEKRTGAVAHLQEEAEALQLVERRAEQALRVEAQDRHLVLGGGGDSGWSGSRSGRRRRRSVRGACGGGGRLRLRLHGAERGPHAHSARVGLARGGEHGRAAEERRVQRVRLAVAHVAEDRHHLHVRLVRAPETRLEVLRRGHLRATHTPTSDRVTTL